MNANEGQTELGLFRMEPADPNVGWLERYLLEVREWMTAGELITVAGREISDQQKRWVRALAGASEVVISGQKGYKHVMHATTDELNHFVNWMESQGKQMIARAERMRRNAHALVG